MKKTLQQLIARYPQIKEVSDEAEDGYWLYLKPGWKREECDEVHSVHEWNMRDLKRAMRFITKCYCVQCQPK